MTAAAPSGVVTFLFTNIEGSTRRWEADAMRAAILAWVALHDKGEMSTERQRMSVTISAREAAVFAVNEQIRQ